MGQCSASIAEAAMNAYQSARSIPGLPVWTFDPSQSEAPVAGKFQSDNASPASVTALYFADTDKAGSDLGDLFSMQPQSWILLTSLSTQKSYLFVAANGWHDQDPIWYAQGMTSFSAETTPLSGDFTVQMIGVPVSYTLATLQINSFVTPVADGDYTVGLGVTSNGIISVKSGIIIGVQEAS